VLTNLDHAVPVGPRKMLVQRLGAHANIVRAVQEEEAGAGRAVAMLSLQETRGSGTDPLGRHFEEPGALASGTFEWAVLRGQTLYSLCCFALPAEL
jgi:hypothetical protein